MTEDEARKISRPYQPLNWERSIGKKGHEESPNRCCASVHDSGRASGFYQCSHKPKVYYGMLGYCGVHDPQAVLARQKKRNEEYKAKSAIENRKWKRMGFNIKAGEAIKKIADGHNDPRALASELVEEYRELWEVIK